MLHKSERNSINERLSYIENNDKFNHYEEMKNSVLEGALREGGPPNLYSWNNIGLLIQYACVGLVYGAFPRTIYPFFNNYLNMDGYQTVAALTIINMPWSFKTFIGIMSDSFPIYGYRRRPYMIIGWMICCFSLFLMFMTTIDSPYYLFPEDKYLNSSSLLELKKNHPERFNFNAPYTGPKYIMMMMVATFGYIIADVASDGMVVEFAQREPIQIRGQTQTTIYFVVALFSVVTSVLIGICMNGPSYGGVFTWTLTFNHIMLILSIICSFAIPSSVFLLKEETIERESFYIRCENMWRICQQRSIWQILGVKFFGGILSAFGSAPSNIIQREWAKVQPFTESMFSTIGNLLYAIALYGIQKWGLHWNWHHTIIFTTLLVVVIDSIVSFITIFNIYRSPWIWLGVPILEEFPLAIQFMISSYIVVEIAEPGYEGFVYGYVMTVFNLSFPFASTLSNNIDAHFDAFQDDIKRDDTEVRWQVAYCFVIMYIMKCLSLVSLIWFPQQKQQAQELKRTGGSNFWAGLFALFLATFAFIWSITISLLSVFPSTSCMKIAGGNGKC